VFLLCFNFGSPESFPFPRISFLPLFKKNNGNIFYFLFATGRFILLNCFDFFLVSVLDYLVLLDAVSWCEVQLLIWLCFDGERNIKHESCDEKVSQSYNSI